MGRRGKWTEKFIMAAEFATGASSGNLTAGLDQGEFDRKEYKYFRMTGVSAREISHMAHHAKPDVKATPDRLRDLGL